MKTTTALSAMLVIAFGLSAPCLARPKGVTVIQVKNIALQQCLHDSYSRITPDGDGRLRHDSSYLIQRYALDNAGVYQTLQKYVANADKNFHKLTLSLKDESGTANNVFQQCMDFYASPELDAFVRQRIMK